MFPASTHKGSAVLAFPEVCKTPNPAGPTPIPYPNIGMRSGTRTTTKTKSTATKSTYKTSSGDEAGVLRGSFQVMQGRTPYNRYGDLWLVAIGLVTLLAMLVRRTVCRLREARSRL